VRRRRRWRRRRRRWWWCYCCCCCRSLTTSLFIGGSLMVMVMVMITVQRSCDAFGEVHVYWKGGRRRCIDAVGGLMSRFYYVRATKGLVGIILGSTGAAGRRCRLMNLCDERCRVVPTLSRLNGHTLRLREQRSSLSPASTIMDVSMSMSKWQVASGNWQGARAERGAEGLRNHCGFANCSCHAMLR
jgi:hypothetical protein